MRVTCFIILAAVLFAGTSVPASAFCTDSDAARAARVIYTVGTWSSLSKFHRQYKDCDEGAVADGYSDRVADLLARRWETLGDLKDITDVNPEFEAFVLYHVDSLMRPEQVRAILENTRNHCPADAAELCGKIEKEVLVSTKQ